MHIAAFDIGMLGANGIVGAGLPIATGAALAARLQGTDGVAVGFFSDGATGEGTFHEALNLASLWSLPVVWVCENNGYASDTPLRESVPTGAVAEFAVGYDMPARQVDGNDVLAVRDAAAEAVARARAGDGPTLLECRTLRNPTHALRDALPADPRLPDEVSGWTGGDPIERFEAVLAERGVADPGALAEARAAVDRELEAAIARALESPFPEPEEALEDVFAGR
jgi:pyruvate dehydrogenase E1 component alpha subunit